MNKGKFIIGVGVLFVLLFAGILVNRPDIVISQRTNAPAIITTVSVPARTGMEKQVILQDLGMTWTICKGTVERRLGRVPGIISYQVDLQTDSATVDYDGAQVTADQIKQAVAEDGFQAREIVEVR